MRGAAVSSPSWEPACMEPDELEEYRAGRARGCQDCTSDFAAAMAREGRCNGIPGDIARLDIIPLVADLDAPYTRSPILLPDGSRRPYKPQVRKELLDMPEEPTRIPRPNPSSPAVDALRELALAAEAAANTRTALDEAIAANDEAQARLQAATAATAPMPNHRKLRKADTRTTEQRQAAVPPTSDELTPRQQQVLDVVVAYNGDRAAAANTLGVTYQSVDETLLRVAAKGKLPDSILTKMPDRVQAMVAGDSATQQESTG